MHSSLQTAKLIQEWLGVHNNKSSAYSATLQRIVEECDVHSDGLLMNRELELCFRLIQPEFIMGNLLRGNQAIPEVYGACGEMIAVEYASSAPLRTPLVDVRPWWRKAELAIAVLDMIQALELTPFGTLYLCDLQWKNLGVVDNHGSGIVIKSIDNDDAIFEGKLMRMIDEERECRIDHDCRVTVCSVSCNKTTHTCSRELQVNNFQVNLGQKIKE